MSGPCETLASTTPKKSDDLQRRPLYLRKRGEFLAAQKGERRNLGFATALLRIRPENGAPARFGLTVSRKTAKLAVERNRIKRRLRAAIAICLAASRPQGFDLVLIARRQVLTAPFTDIAKALDVCVSTPPKPRSRAASVQDKSRKPL